MEDTKNTFRVKVNMSGVTPFTAAVLKLGQTRKFRESSNEFSWMFYRILISITTLVESDGKLIAGQLSYYYYLLREDTNYLAMPAPGSYFK